MANIFISRIANAPPPGFCVGAGPPALGSSSPVRRREGEGARDAGSMTAPRALKPCGSRAARPRAGRLGLSARCCRLFGLQRRKTAAFPASRARCLRLAPWDPRWSDFSGTVPFSHFSGSRTYPPLWDLAGANAVGRCERIDRPIPWHTAGAPGPHGLGRRDGWCVPPAAATAPTGPDVSGAGPEGPRGASPPPHLQPSPRFERPRARPRGTGRIVNIFL
jgi:hypothetical protein